MCLDAGSTPLTFNLEDKVIFYRCFLPPVVKATLGILCPRKPYLVSNPPTQPRTGLSNPFAFDRNVRTPHRFIFYTAITVSPINYHYEGKNYLLIWEHYKRYILVQNSYTQNKIIFLCYL